MDGSHGSDCRPAEKNPQMGSIAKMVPGGPQDSRQIRSRCHQLGKLVEDKQQRSIGRGFRHKLKRLLPVTKGGPRVIANSFAKVALCRGCEGP